MKKKKRSFKNITVLISNGKSDSNGDIFDLEKIELPKNFNLPVTREFNHEDIIGEAKLTKDVKNKTIKIIADISLNKFGFENYYPAVGGFIKRKEEKDDNVIIKDFKLTSISICYKGNTDKRIKKLKN